MATLYKSNGKYTLKDLKLSLTNDFALEQGETLEVDVKVVDERIITEKQRAFIFVLCKEIGWHLGEDSEYIRLLMQQYNANLREIEVESLSKCSMTYANNLIDTIITFAIDNRIPLAKSILEENKYRFTEKQTYAMILKRVCVVCGNRADIHHIDTIGMGHNRKKVSHIGKRVIPLCRVHHNKIHNVGNEKFLQKYHLQPITVEEKLEHFIKKGALKIYE